MLREQAEITKLVLVCDSCSTCLRTIAHSSPNLDAPMPARRGLLLCIAMFALFEGSTVACASVRVVAVRFKGRNSCLSLGEYYLKDAWPSTGSTHHRFHDTMDSQTSNATRAVGLSDPQHTARRKRMFEFLTRLRAVRCVPLSMIPSPATNDRPML